MSAATPWGTLREGTTRTRIGESVAGQTRRGELGGEDDVLVVRQNDHVARTSGLDRRPDVARARVHRLAAANNFDCADGAQEPLDAVARADRHDGDGRGRCRRLLTAAGGERLELLLHILDLLVRECAERASVRERVVRRERVQVHAHRPAAADHEQALAHRLQPRADGVRVELAVVDRIDDELGAEARLLSLAVQLLACVEPGLIDGAEVRRLGRRLLAAQRAQHAVEQHEQALRARIDYARFL